MDDEVARKNRGMLIRVAIKDALLRVWFIEPPGSV